MEMSHRAPRLAGVAVVTLAALVACSGGADRPGGVAQGSSPASPPARGGESAARSGSPSAGTPRPNLSDTGDDRPSGTRQVAVYYLGGATRGIRLYREFRSVPRYRTALRSAVDAMLHVAPKDPDYRSLWPRETRLRGVSITGATATVDLSREALRGSGGAEAERMSVQQLVHTVTAAAPAVSQVRVLVEGRASGRLDGREIADLWGHGGLRDQPLRRGPQAEVLAAVWITSHLDGQTVGLDVSFGGSATVFEATVSWQVRSACPPDTGPCPPPTVYREGFATASRGAPDRGEWRARTTIPRAATAFRYVELRAFESSAEDGRPTNVETKVLRLR